MTTDIKLTTDRDLEIDPTGDIATVQFHDNIRQQHANAFFRAVERTELQFLNLAILEDLRATVREELLNMRYVDNINYINLEIAGSNRIEGTIETNATDEPLNTGVDL